jgi:hypothetical protein
MQLIEFKFGFKFRRTKSRFVGFTIQFSVTFLSSFASYFSTLFNFIVCLILLI